MDKWNALYKYLWEKYDELNRLINEDMVCCNYEDTDMMITYALTIEEIMDKMEELEKECVDI